MGFFPHLQTYAFWLTFFAVGSLLLGYTGIFPYDNNFYNGAAEDVFTETNSFLEKGFDQVFNGNIIEKAVGLGNLLWYAVRMLLSMVSLVGYGFTPILLAIGLPVEVCGIVQAGITIVVVFEMVVFFAQRGS